MHFDQGNAADAFDALIRFGGVRFQDFQGNLVPADGKRKLGNLHGQVHVVRIIREHDAEPGNFGVHFLPLVVSAKVGFEFLQAVDQRAELAVHPLQHRGQRGELAMDAIRHFEFGLVSHFMADVGPGMLQQRANLNLSLQSQDFRGNGDRDAGVLELLRIDRNDVMHRAVAELGGTQSLAHVLAVGPIDAERLLDEPAHGLHLIRSLGDDPPAAEVRDAGSADRRAMCLSDAYRVCVCGGSSPRNWGRFWHAPRSRPEAQIWRIPV